MALISREGFGKHAASKRKGSPQEQAVPVLLSSAATGKSELLPKLSVSRSVLRPD